MNPRVISDIVTILEEILPKHLYAHDFTTEHYKKLLVKLSVAANETLFNDKKGAIRKALTRHFSNSYQEIELQVTFTSFALKKKFVDPTKPEEYDRVIFKN